MRLTTHPNNVEWLRKHLRTESKPVQRPFRGDWISPADPLWMVEIVPNVHVPERKIRIDWSPPDGDRFTLYGPEDESWMRPLGLGKFVPVDLGPLFYEIPMRIFINDLFRNGIPVLEPRGIIHSTTS